MYGSLLVGMGGSSARHWLTKPCEDTQERVCELLLSCAQDQVHTEDLKVYLREARQKHVELAQLSYQGATLAAYCDAHKEELPFLQEVHKILADHTLRVFMLNASRDANQFDAFKKYFDAHPCDIDAIMLLPQRSSPQSLGGYYFSRHSDDKAYTDVLHYVDRYRTQSPLAKRKKIVAEECRQLVNEVVKGRKDIGELARYVKENPVNIDEITWDSRGTVGWFLNSWEGTASILALNDINEHRTYKKSNEELVRLLTYEVVYYQKSFDMWKSRYRQTPFNADLFIIDSRKKLTLGQFLDQVPADRFHMRVAHVVQEGRTDKSAFLRGLLKRYASDRKELASITHWLRIFPQLLTTVYDPSEPALGTCADYIQRLNKPELLALLVQQVPQQVGAQPKEKTQSWVTLRAGIVGVVLAVISYYVLSRWLTRKKQEEPTVKEQQVVAVS